MAGKERAAVCRMDSEKGMRLFMEGAIAVGRYLLGTVLCQPSARFKIKVKQQSRTCLGRAGTASCCVRVERCSSLMSGFGLTDNGLKSFAFASLIDNLFLGVAVGDAELYGASGRYVTRKFFCQPGNHLVNIAETDVCKFG